MAGDPQAGKRSCFPDAELFHADLRDQALRDRACRGVTHVVDLATPLDVL